MKPTALFTMCREIISISFPAKDITATSDKAHPAYTGFFYGHVTGSGFLALRTEKGCELASRKETTA